MEIRQLKTFLTVARLSSFHQAAKSMHYAQSTVSAQIQALEEELGIKLFDRLGRTITLTGAGESLREYAVRLLDLESEAKGVISEPGELKGSLVVRVPESLCVHRFPGVIKEFRLAHPQVSLQFITCAQESLGRDLAKGMVDLAFLLAPGITRQELEVEVLGVEELLLVSGPGHPLASRRVVETAEIPRHDLLLSKVDCSYRRQLEELLPSKARSRERIVEFSSVEALKACLRSGHGVSVLPGFAITGELEREELRALPWRDGPMETATLMIWNRGKWLSPILRAFMTLCRQKLYV